MARSREIPKGDRYIIPPLVSQMFNDLRRADKNNDLMVVMVTRKRDGAIVPLLCLVNTIPPGTKDIIPVAEFIVEDSAKKYKHPYYTIESFF